MDLSDTRIASRATASGDGDPPPEGGSSTAPPGWSATLELAYGARGGHTVPTLRRHVGPLRVQKGFTPEGPGVWHQVVVHPPGGIAGGDALRIDVAAAAGAHALLTAPGAAKWYRSGGATASQLLAIEVAAGAALEWLAPETIVFDGARARLATRCRVARGGTLILAELFSLGRPASGERFERGRLDTAIDIHDMHGAPRFLERTRLAGSDPLLDSPVGLAGRPLFGTLIAVSDRLDDDATGQRALSACRDALASTTTAEEVGVTRLPGVLVVRWRGCRADAGQAVLRSAWAELRPLLLDRPAVAPRIWST